MMARCIFIIGCAIAAIHYQMRPSFTFNIGDKAEIFVLEKTFTGERNAPSIKIKQW